MNTQYILLAIIFCQAVQSRRLLASEASKCDQCAAYGFKLGTSTKKACWNCDCGDGKRICGCIHCKNEPKPLPRPAFRVIPGADCEDGYEPLTSSWKNCKTAAVALGFKGDSINFVEYNYPWGSKRPQGCFQSNGNNRIHFNRGPGGNFEGTDKIICKLGEQRQNQIYTRTKGYCRGGVNYPGLNTLWKCIRDPTITNAQCQQHCDNDKNCNAYDRRESEKSECCLFSTGHTGNGGNGRECYVSMKATPSSTTAPTKEPTPTPTNFPTPSPTTGPTNLPTPSPSNFPTCEPSPSPTMNPTNDPTTTPTTSPTTSSISEPTSSPTEGYEYVLLTEGGSRPCEKPRLRTITDKVECGKAAQFLGLSHAIPKVATQSENDRLFGCRIQSFGSPFWLNTKETPKWAEPASKVHKAICAVELEAKPEPKEYTRTKGYCRGGVNYPGLNTLWKCTRDPTITNAQCQQHCDNDENCNAYDRRESEKSECCLFSTGHTGNGGNGRECYVSKAKPEPKEYTRTKGYCRGGVKYPGLNTLWKCIRDPTITNAQCQQHCDNDENCNAYDRRESEKSECCLFSTGHTGNGGNGRECYVNSGRSTPPQ